MELSVREVAALTGASPRTVRARMARGELPAVKKNGRWRIDRRRLPLTEDQHRGLQAKAEEMRQALDAVLPPRLTATSGQRSRSLADLDAFRLGADLLAAIRAASPETFPAVEVTRLKRRLEMALLGLAEAVAHYDRQLKLDALNRSRASFAQALGLLLARAGVSPPDPARGWALALETEILPALAGFARWVDGLGRRRQP